MAVCVLHERPSWVAKAQVFRKGDGKEVVLPRIPKTTESIVPVCCAATQTNAENQGELNECMRPAEKNM